MAEREAAPPERSTGITCSPRSTRANAWFSGEPPLKMSDLPRKCTALRTWIGITTVSA